MALGGRSRASAFRWSWCLAAWLLASVQSWAQVGSPRRLDDDDAGPAAVSVDTFDNLHLLYRQGAGLTLRTLLVSGGEQLARIGGETADEPTLLLRGIGMWAAWSESSGPGRETRQVWVASGVGPRLGEPSRVSPPEEDARAPALRLDAERRPVLAWERHDGAGEPLVCVSRPDRDLAVLGAGTSPSLEVDATGRVHVVFIRDGRVVRCVDGREGGVGGFGPAEPLLASTSPSAFWTSTGLVDGERLWIGFADATGLYLISAGPGAPGAPRQLATGPIRGPRLRVRDNGVIAATWEEAGTIRYALGNSIFLPEPIEVPTEFEVDDAAPGIDSDSFANAYVAFVHDGGLWLASTADVPTAGFRADPARGEAPLDVRFHDESRGTIASWHWDFGDGHESQSREPVHVYEETGEYEVRLTVTGPGGSGASTTTGRVLVTDPSNLMWVADVRVFPGQRGVFLPVLVTHDRPAQGFQVAGVFDPEVLEVTGVDFEATNVGGFVPELAAFNVSHDPVRPFFTAGVLFDIQPPFDRRTLPPGEAQRVLNLVVDVSADLAPPLRSPVALRHGVGDPPLNNIITSGAQTILTVLGPPGHVIVDEVSFPPPRFFVRGDVDGDAVVGLTDAIQTLNFLFLGGPEPRCRDAADTSDNGVIDISDAAFTLNFLFRAGPYPPPPYPNAGLDPTEDGLPPCGL